MLDVELVIDNTYSMHMEIMNAINTVRYQLYLRWSGIWVIVLKTSSSDFIYANTCRPLFKVSS